MLSSEYNSENEVHISKINRNKSWKKYKLCSVPGCETRDNKLFLFPSNDKIKEIWKAACKIKRPLKKFEYACRKHFNPDEFYMRGRRHKLNPGSIPSQNLPQGDNVLDVKAIIKKPGPLCAVISCQKSTSDGITLHHFPRDINLRKRWLAVCKLRKGSRNSRNTHICSDHFQDDDFRVGENGSRILKRGMMPTRNLPSLSVERSERSLSEERDFSDYSESTELELALESISSSSDGQCSEEFDGFDEYEGNEIDIDVDSDCNESDSLFMISQGTQTDQTPVFDKEIQTDRADRMPRRQISSGFACSFSVFTSNGRH